MCAYLYLLSLMLLGNDWAPHPKRFDRAITMEEVQALSRPSQPTETATPPPPGQQLQQPCFLVIHKKVYDVTTFMSRHPGGMRSLTMKNGQDATNCFDRFHHGPRAANLLQQMYVADLATPAGPAEVTAPAPRPPLPS